MHQLRAFVTLCLCGLQVRLRLKSGKAGRGSRTGS